MERSWKLLYGSVVGTSHERLGEPCQDYAHGVVIAVQEASWLLAACADGAGSASHAYLGAKTACLTFIRLASAYLRDGLLLNGVDSRRMLDWYTAARGQLSLEASCRGLEIRDFACTLLAAIIGDEGAAFAQIGDGAIVFRDGDGFAPAFWPQTGEYASSTFFLTGEGLEERLAFRSLGQRVDELALFTDGLQPLALHYASRAVHSPFFAPMFASLRQSVAPEELESPLREFLKSKPVTDRTDDDKTLMLATRLPVSHDTR